MIFELAAANAVIFAAAALQAATGVGFAMVAVPLLALISLAWVPAPMLICNIGLSIVILNRGRDALDRAEAPPLILGLTLGTFAGAVILALIEGRGLGVLIGGIILVAVAASLFTPPLRITRGRLLSGAFVGGATGIIAAMHGPPLIILYQREHPEKVRATMAGVFLFGCFLALGSLWLAGLLGWEQVWRGLALLPGVALGYFVGRALGGRMSPGAVRYAMLGVSGTAGLALLLRSL
ncbi:MAG TPA: sulfite exporter TauE/SafE family protein [Thermohalobaculum sp.]|nr:sulfite exporter TauE/SafE family protein [Thermohalobaculum sp.]